jgi:DNA-binding FadR family transcriptional regulator
MVLDFRREGTPALLPWYLLAGRFDRPLPALARELLSLRTLLAAEAVRLAALYATSSGLDEPRRILAEAPALEADPVAHALNELDLFLAIVIASGIWPAVWLANVFWAPMRELHSRLASAIPSIPVDYQPQMQKLLGLIEARDAAGADRHIRAWFSRVDAGLLGEMERVLGAVPLAGVASGKATAS